MSALVYNIGNIPTLIESDGNGYIRMWEFHTASLITVMESYPKVELRGICLWNDNYLFAAGNDNEVKLFNLISGFVKSFKGHSAIVCCLEKIIHPKYGECLISQAIDDKLKIKAPQK